MSTHSNGTLMTNPHCIGDGDWFKSQFVLHCQSQVVTEPYCESSWIIWCVKYVVRESIPVSDSLWEDANCDTIKQNELELANIYLNLFKDIAKQIR